MIVNHVSNAALKARLSIGVSLLTLCMSAPAMAQAVCADGSAGPICRLSNSGESAAIVGTPGTLTILENSGTISGTPAIALGGSVLLGVNNLADGVINGNIQAVPRLGLIISNAGIINGDVVLNDTPAPNVFTGPIIAFLSDGGTVNGNVTLGNSGFGTAYFLQRGTDSGVTGVVSAGGGLDIYAKSYGQTQSVALGGYDLLPSFEIEGYEVLGSGTTLTLTGSGSTINLSGNGNVVNMAEIDLINTAGIYPVEVIPNAIGYFQPNIAAFPRPTITPGQNGSIYSPTFGNALNSFVNAGTITGDIRLSTANFLNSDTIYLNTRGGGTVIHGGANRDFLFENSGTILMSANGARTGPALIEAEFEGGTQAALRIRSALNTVEAKDVAIGNSGTITGGLDAVVAAKNFTFENSGTIAGLETADYFARGITLTVGPLDLVVGENARDEFNADSADILNSETGVISHGFSAALSTFAATVENRGMISASGSEYGVALKIEQDLLQDDEEADFDAASFAFVNSGVLNGSAVFEVESSAADFVNSGSVTRAAQPLDPAALPYFGSDYSAFEIESETVGSAAIRFTNSGTLRNLDRGSSALTIEVEAGDDEPEPGATPALASATVHIINSGTISAEGGATITPAAVLPDFLEPGTLLINPIAALSIDATDVTGGSLITIDNLADGVISVSGHVGVVTPAGYMDQGSQSNGGATAALVAQGHMITINNAGIIRGGTGSTFTEEAMFDGPSLVDNYLAGAIQTLGTENESGTYVGSVDHVINAASGQIIGSIDLGANDDIIENYGSISGNVFLRGGNDIFIHSLLGEINGMVDGGAGEDILVFDISGAYYTGAIDPILRAKFTSFEIEQLIGVGTVITDGPTEIAEGGAVTFDENSSLGSISGSETGNEQLVTLGTVDGDIDMRGGNNSVVNQGLVTGNVTAGDGQNSIANQGVIEGDVILGNGGNSFANNGTVDGDILFGSGDDQLVLAGNWSLGGTVTGGGGDDSVLATLTGTNESPQSLDLSGFEAIETFNVHAGVGSINGIATFDAIDVSGGRLIGAAGSTINADIHVASGATFGSAGDVNGNIAIGAGGIFSPGASPATMTVTGDISLAGNSTTIFEFQATENGPSDRIIIKDGSLAIADGALLDMTLLGAQPFMPGTAYDMIIIDSSNPADAITGEFTIGNWDRTAVPGVLRYTPTRLQLLGIFAAPAGISGQTGAAVDYVNDLLIAGQASGALLSAVPSLLDGDAMASAAAFGLLTPEAYATASQLGVEHGLILSKAARSGAAASPRRDAGLYSFVQGLGEWRTLNGDAATGASRTTSRSYGIMGGFGYGSESGSLGAFISYIDSRQTIAGLDARTEADGIIAGLSGQMSVGGFNLTALAAYDWSKASTTRAVPGSTRVAADYNLRSLIVDATAGYQMAVSGSWAVRPELGFTHVSTRRGQAVETGSAAFAFAVDRTRTSASFVDATILLQGGQQEGATFHPWIKLGIRHQLEGEVSAATAGFIGSESGLTVQGASRKDSMATAGAGFSADLAPSLRLYGSYQRDFGSTHADGINLGVRFAF